MHNLNSVDTQNLTEKEKNDFITILNLNKGRVISNSIIFDASKNPVSRIAVADMGQQRQKLLKNAYEIGKTIAYYNGSNALSVNAFISAGSLTENFISQNENQQYLKLGINIANRAKEYFDPTLGSLNCGGIIHSLNPWEQLQLFSAHIATTQNRKDNLAVLKKLWDVSMVVTPAARITSKLMKIGGIALDPFSEANKEIDVQLVYDLPKELFQENSKYAAALEHVAKKAPAHIRNAIEIRKNTEQNITQLSHNKLIENKKRLPTINKNQPNTETLSEPIDKAFIYLEKIYQEIDSQQQTKHNRISQTEVLANFQ